MPATQCSARWTTLERTGERPSLAAIGRVSKTVDPKEPKGISESAILHNEQALALYRQHAGRKQRARKTPPRRRTDIGNDNFIRVSPDRDRGRARHRYLRASKTELVERLLVAEQAYADMEGRWFNIADELLVWIIIVDRLLARMSS